MVIQVSEALDLDTSEIVSVERTEGSFVDGIFIKDDPTTFIMFASVQQPSGSELNNLPEGERDKDVRKFISNKLVRTSQDSSNTLADVIIYNGDRFRIIKVEDWSVYGQTTSYGIHE